MSKPYQTTTPDPQRTAYHAPEAFTLKRAKSTALAFVAVLLVLLAGWLELAHGWTVPAVVVAVLAIYAGMNAFWLSSLTERLVAKELPKHPKAKRTGDTWRIHLRREIPVGDRGAVDMDPDPVDLPVAPAQFVNIVRQMKRTGTSRNKRPAGVSQPLWAKIMTALEDLDGAHKGPNGYEFTDDIDALLEDIARW